MANSRYAGKALYAMLNIPQNVTWFGIYDTSTDSAVANEILYDANNQAGCSKKMRKIFCTHCSV
jgi:hypothetical protein